MVKEYDYVSGYVDRDRHTDIGEVWRYTSRLNTENVNRHLNGYQEGGIDGQTEKREQHG